MPPRVSASFSAGRTAVRDMSCMRSRRGAGRDVQAGDAHRLARRRFDRVGVGLDVVGARVVVARAQAVEGEQQQQRDGRDERRPPHAPVTGEDDRRNAAP